ncbi:hypothetical protein FHU38_000699 [Saccharomonospora amisosensis]|uniref:Uncharacterized protein n=1 Tax=Saccharomonospora amisosensis TaxID=1128677 RepID=A0A7X5ULR6_9PSEU|nr:hypothetical protein [Saccharomonospora amisosensis]
MVSRCAAHPAGVGLGPVLAVFEWRLPVLVNRGGRRSSLANVPALRFGQTPNAAMTPSLMAS